MKTAAAIAYVLVTVTYGNDITVKDGFKSLELCEDVRQIRENGHTVAEQRQIDEKLAEQRKRDQEAEKEKQKEWDRKNCTLEGDRRVCKLYPGSISVGGAVQSYSILNTNSIKYSKCFIDPTPKDK